MESARVRTNPGHWADSLVAATVVSAKPGDLVVVAVHEADGTMPVRFFEWLRAELARVLPPGVGALIVPKEAAPYTLPPRETPAAYTPAEDAAYRLGYQHGLADAAGAPRRED